MIVNKILLDNQYVPDLPEGAVYESYFLNEDGLTYTVTGVTELNGVPLTISTLQGKLQLIKMGLLDTIEGMITQEGAAEKIYWEYAIEWERSSPILNRLAPAVGMDQNGLDQFFISASKLI
jgi:hypothetical protein